MKPVLAEIKSIVFIYCTGKPRREAIILIAVRGKRMARWPDPLNRRRALYH